MAVAVFDAGMYTVGFVPSSLALNEGQSATVDLRIVPPVTAGEVAVRLLVPDNSDRASIDVYPTEVTFRPGLAVERIDVIASDDTFDEPSVVYELEVEPRPDAPVKATTNLLVTVLPDDRDVVRRLLVNPKELEMIEGDPVEGVKSFTIRTQRPLADPAVVTAGLLDPNLLEITNVVLTGGGSERTRSDTQTTLVFERGNDIVATITVTASPNALVASAINPPI